MSRKKKAAIVFLFPLLIYLSYKAFIAVKVDEINVHRNVPYSFKELNAEKFISSPAVLKNIVQKKFEYHSGGLRYKIYNVEINSFDGNDRNDLGAELWMNKGGRNENVVLVLPITGANDPGGLISWYMVNFKGYDAIRVIADRRFFDSKKIEGAENIEEVKDEIRKFERGMRTRIINHFRLIQWAKNRGYKNIGLIGVSLGAIEGGIVSLDRNIKASALIIGGGDIAEILTFSQEPFVKKWREITLKKCKALKGQFELVDLYQMLHEIFNDTDPLRYAGFISPHRVLLINSKNDKTVPLKSAMSFYVASNMPRIILINTDHTGTKWYVLYILSQVGKFFDERFNTK